MTVTTQRLYLMLLCDRILRHTLIALPVLLCVLLSTAQFPGQENAR